MGNNRIDLNISDNGTIQSDDVNQFGLALDGDLLPRQDGQPTPRAGALGSAVTPWSEVFTDSLVIEGTPLDACLLYTSPSPRDS